MKCKMAADQVLKRVSRQIIKEDAPKEHHKHLKTNVLERLNQELKRRTQVIRIFPNQASSLRLLRALAVEIHEDWLESPRYLNMEALREQRKTELRGLNSAA